MPEGIDVLTELEQMQEFALSALSRVEDDASLNAWRTSYTGRSAPIMLVFTRLPQLPKELRPQVGQRANQVKLALEAALAEKEEAIKRASLQKSLASERLDVTLPGRRPPSGRLHPQTQTLREIYRVFGDMGFQIYRSPDVETDEYNFELLNIPAYHPDDPLWYSQMGGANLPEGIDLNNLKNALYDTYKIEIPLFRWNNLNLIRFSLQAYNAEEDIIKLEFALKALLK